MHDAQRLKPILVGGNSPGSGQPRGESDNDLEMGSHG